MTSQPHIAIAIVPLVRYHGPNGEKVDTMKGAWAIMQQAVDSGSG
jgi:hypothetical protein